MRNADHPAESAKSDYAINGGDKYINSGPGPVSSRLADLRSYKWPDLKPFTGVSLVRSRISTAMLRDGTSTTYLLGEKYISAEHYSTGTTRGDDQTMYLGDDADIRRWTMERPLPDNRGVDSKEHFGSAHSSGCHFAFCDGSVRFVSYQIDQEIHRRLGNRRDRIPVDLSVLE